MERAYAIEKVLKEDLPQLQHGNDGLIYTCAETGYVVGTDERMLEYYIAPTCLLPCLPRFVELYRLKWKPPSENSIDFKLELRFPPLRDNPNEPDFYAKPVFLLNVWQGDSRAANGGKEAIYKYFDYMYLDDGEWEKYAPFLPRRFRFPLII